MKTARQWTSIWDADTQPGQFSYQGGSVMWTSSQYEWGNGLQINETSGGYIQSLQKEMGKIKVLAVYSSYMYSSYILQSYYT